MSPTPPTDLPPDDCPLLTRHGGPDAAALIARYNAAAARLRAVPADPELAALPASGKLDPAAALLSKARGLMTRRRYAVGFIGLTQAGKSTTVNNVLGEEVCKSGVGDATSSQPSRILFGDRPALDVEYLTPRRFAARRQAASQEIGLATPPDDDREFLEMLSRPEAFRDLGADRPRLKDDIAYLKAFLASRLRNPDYLSDPAREQSGLPYAQRYDYTTHKPGADGSAALLLREARFHIPNPRLPADLELCDLPGLDSKRSIDDIVTREYLPDLNGTFLFVNVGMNLNSSGMRGTLGMVSREFGGAVAGRAWVIFTKMDSLTEHHFRAGGEENIFDVITRLLDDTGIPPAQVCFCSNDLASALRKNVAEKSEADRRAYAADRLKQAADRPVPDACPPALRPAWEELLKDGGIERIRALMTGEVATSLATQIRKDVAAALTDFDEQFDRVTQAEKARLAGGPQLLEKVTTCQDVVLDLWVRLGGRPADFPILAQQGEHLRSRLSRLFENESTRRVLSSLPPENIAGQFRTHARVLNETLRAELAGDLLDPIYQYVVQTLAPLPQVPIGPGREGCQALWREYCARDRDPEVWRAAVPGFADEAFGRWLAEAAEAALNGDVYIGLMREKIAVTVHQTVHAVRVRLRTRLREIQRELSLLTDEPAPAAG